MLSLDQCRALLDVQEISDDQLRALCDQLYALARVAIVASVADSGQFGRLVEQVSDPERADIEERAAILEFDAKMPRPQAERLARTQRRQHRRQ
jgi:hypothetical protein